MASPTNPESDGWIVYPDCTVEQFALDADGELEVSSEAVERVDSLPTQSVKIVFSLTPLTRGGDFSNARDLKRLFLSGISANRLDIFEWVSGLGVLSVGCLQRCDIDTLKGISFPETLAELSISRTKTSNLDGANLPRGLKSLYLNDNQFATLAGLDFLSIEAISFSMNPISTLAGVMFPSSMNVFECSECPITSVRGVKWPRNLIAVNFYDDKIISFEIRESDLPAFMGLQMFGAEQFEQTSCDEPTANLTALTINPDISLCVITDARFDELYTVTPPPVTVTPAPSLPPSGSQDAGSGSDASSNSIDVGDETADGGTTTTSRPKPIPAPGSPTPEDEDSRGSSDSEPPRTNSSSIPATPKPSSSAREVRGGSQTPTALSPDDSRGGDEARVISSSSSRTIVLVGSIAGGLCVLLAIFIIYRVIAAAKKRRKNAANRDEYTPMNSPTSINDTTEPDWSQLETLAAAFRGDHALAGFQVDHTAVSFGDRITTDGATALYRGSFKGKRATIRQILPDAWRDESALRSFVDKIRMCARLQHPKITTFIGVTFTSIRDLAAVSEYMAGGDLDTLVHRHPESTGREWFDTWTSLQLPCKARMAADVAEAVVYLHSFEVPIIYRDLRAKHVLLDASGKCKLSDFGISSDVNVDAMMAREKSTAAWMAPEVLRGEAYDEKADIYSFGVLLVELDRCGHPFADDPAFVSSESSAVERNSRLVRLVGTGQLRPSPSPTCPEAVSALISRCVSFEPSDRPTAMEMFYELRKAQRSSQAQ